MLITKTVIITMQRGNVRFYKEKYKCKVGDIINVNVEDLLKSCDIELYCQCDLCGKYFYQNFKDSPKLYEQLHNKEEITCKECNFKNKKHYTIFDDDIDIQKINDLYWNNNFTLEKIAEIYKTNPPTISKYMNKNNINIRSISEANKMKLNEKYICNLYIKEHLSCDEIARVINVSTSKIYDVLIENNISIRNKSEATNCERWRKLRQKFDVDKETLEDLYFNKKLSTLEISQLYHVNSWNVSSLAKRYNIKIIKTPENIRIRNSLEYKQWRQSVFERDNYTCQCCKDSKGGNLQAHHIKNFANNEDLRFDLNNGITLCSKCHDFRIVDSFHYIYGARNNSLEQLNEYIQFINNKQDDWKEVEVI